eukprot:3616948-Pleurochrysis_carterae.AAC.1
MDGGQVADSPELTPFLRDAVEAVRTQPPGLASFRNLAPAACVGGRSGRAAAARARASPRGARGPAGQAQA